MRKRFDVKLAGALDITVKALLRGYKTTPPSQAGFLAEIPGTGEPWKKKEWAELDTDKKLMIIAYHLGSEGDDVQRLIDFGIALIESNKTREGRRWAVSEGKLNYNPHAK
jgi:hypothetical protein